MNSITVSNHYDIIRQLIVHNEDERKELCSRILEVSTELVVAGCKLTDQRKNGTATIAIYLDILSTKRYRGDAEGHGYTLEKHDNLCRLYSHWGYFYALLNAKEVAMAIAWHLNMRLAQFGETCMFDTLQKIPSFHVDKSLIPMLNEQSWRELRMYRGSANLLTSLDTDDQKVTK